MSWLFLDDEFVPVGSTMLHFVHFSSFTPCWSTSVLFVQFGLLWLNSVYFSSFRSILVHFGLFQSTSVYCGPHWSILVHFSLFQPTLVRLIHFGPLQFIPSRLSTLLHLGPFRSIQSSFLNCFYFYFLSLQCCHYKF